MTSAPDLIDEPWKSKLRRWLIIFLIACPIVVGVWFAARPAYLAFKSWRSRQLAAQAEKFIGQHQWPKAIDKAEAAFVLKRTEPAALRAMARVMTHSTNAVALQFWQQFILTGQASAPERRDFVELAIRFRSLAQASDELKGLLAEAPNEPRNLWLASQLFTALGDSPQAVYYVTRARLLDPANKQYQFSLSTLLFDSGDAEQQSAARSNLWSLADDPGQLGLDALAFLSSRSDLTDQQRRQLIIRLKRSPQSGLTQELLALDHSIRLEPERRPQLLDEALARYRPAEPTPLTQVAVWLNQHEEFQRTLQLVPRQKAFERKELFIPHLDALAALGRWDELRTILESRLIPLEKTYSEGFQARCAMQLGNGAAATIHWNRALSSAERNSEQLAWLALYAEKCGEFDSARKAYHALIPCVADVRPVYQALKELTGRSGTTEQLRQLLADMLRRWPEDPNLRNDYAYLTLLLSQEPAASRRTAEELVRESPESLPRRTTLALACYRLRDYPAASEVYEGRRYDWRLALPGNRAVHAAVLSASGKVAEAREEARAIPRNRLRPEELELIRPLL
jgi:predicted Zn-dependent protease